MNCFTRNIFLSNLGCLVLYFFGNEIFALPEVVNMVGWYQCLPQHSRDMCAL